MYWCFVVFFLVLFLCLGFSILVMYRSVFCCFLLRIRFLYVYLLCIRLSISMLGVLVGVVYMLVLCLVLVFGCTKCFVLS